AKVVSFTGPSEDVDCNVDPLPSLIHMEWSVVNATGVTLTIDGGGIFDSYDGATGSADVPFSCGSAKHTYLLTTTGGGGTPAQQKIVVLRAKPVIDEFYGPLISGTGPCTAPYNVSLHYSVFHATGATIESNGQVLGNDNGKMAYV